MTTTAPAHRGTGPLQWVRKDRRTGPIVQQADGTWDRELVTGMWHLVGPSSLMWCGAKMRGLRTTRRSLGRADAPMGETCVTCLIAYDTNRPRPFVGR